MENTANQCEKVTFSGHFEQNVQRKAGPMILCIWGDDDKYGIEPNVFSVLTKEKVMSMSIEDDFYFHFDKNTGSNALQEDQFHR